MDPIVVSSEAVQKIRMGEFCYIQAEMASNGIIKKYLSGIIIASAECGNVLIFLNLMENGCF